jgi:hypothetical protein
LRNKGINVWSCCFHDWERRKVETQHVIMKADKRKEETMERREVL